MRTFEDRVALVTGAGSGIGKAMAVAFAAAGGRVVVCDIDAARAAATVAEIHRLSSDSDGTYARSDRDRPREGGDPENGDPRVEGDRENGDPREGGDRENGDPRVGLAAGDPREADERETADPRLGRRTGGDAVAVAADIGDEASVAALVESAIGAYGRIDALFNNAGIMDSMALPADISPELWDRVLRVNLTGTFLVTHAVLPHMLREGRGAIVNTASEAGVRGGAAGAAYTASKHGVVGLTRSVAWAYAKDGIRCNAILPGPTITGIADGAIFDQAGAARLSPVLSLGDRFAQPEQMADAALFLASDAASFVNGAIVPVDGGWSAG